MKRTLFITIGSASLFLIFSLWLYLLLFGTPRTVDEVVGDFGFDNVTATPITVIPDTATGEGRQINLSSGTLYQLTTKPVAGFDFIDTGTSTQILYAERGTGHIYQINIDNGEEARLLQKTFVAINRAYFAEDGSAAILIGESNIGTIAYLEELDPSRTPHEFPETAENIAFVPGREVRYTISNLNGTVGYAYDLDTTETTELFGIPLSDVSVIWNTEETLIYNRTAPTFTGSLYRVSGDTLSKAGSSGIAYSAFARSDFPSQQVETYAHPQSGNLVSQIRNLSSTEEISLGATALSEKCAFDSQSTTVLWCASPLELISPQAQSAWYKGLVSFTDFLWKIDLVTGTATETDNLLLTSGREIDVIDMVTNADSAFLLFKNKNDDTLWLKRLSAPAELDSAANEELLSNGEQVTDGEI